MTSKKRKKSPDRHEWTTHYIDLHTGETVAVGAAIATRKEVQESAAENAATLTKVRSNAQAIANRYKRRCWWVPVEDVKQEAVKAQITALKNYDPTKGPELGAYLWYAGLYAARRLVHKLSAPVSHSHRVEKLRHLTRTTLMVETAEGHPQDRPELVEHHQTPEALTHRARVEERVRARATALLGADGARFALLVIAGEYRAKDIVQEHGGELSEVYAATQRVKAILFGDQELYDLWRDI